MINKFKILILFFLIFSISSCSSWDPYDNPIENRVKKVRGFFTGLSGKSKLKYSTFDKNYERNRAIYYKDNLSKFLDSNYKKDEYESFYRIVIKLGNNKDKTVVLKNVYKIISNYCVSDKSNFPKFHKVAGDKNIMRQKVSYGEKDLSNFEKVFSSVNIGDHIGTFGCFKKNVGHIWKISISPEINNRKREALIKITPYADYTNTKRKNIGRSSNGW